MSKEKNIAIALTSLFSTVAYSGKPIAFYDILRDDAEKLHIYLSGVIAEDMSTKSTTIHRITLMLGIRNIFDGVYEGNDAINDIGDQVETLLANNLVISQYSTVEQHLARSFFVEKNESDKKEVIKTYIYNLIIQYNG